MTDTPDETLVEKAARLMYEANDEYHAALHGERGWPEGDSPPARTWDTANQYHRDLYTIRARAAIAAAAPDIRAQALRDAADAMDEEGGWEHPQWWLRDRAEEVGE